MDAIAKDIQQAHSNPIAAVLMSYVPGSGGNFLINCLALTDKVVLPSLSLAHKQIMGKLSRQDKLQYLLKEIGKIKENNTWNDLGLGRSNLGLHNTNIAWDLYNHGLIFAIPEHCENDVLSDKKKFPNCRIIGIENSRVFLQRYRSARLIDFANFNRLNDLWTRSRMPDWPELPPAYKENLQQPPFCDLAIDDKIQTLLPSLQQVEDYYHIQDQQATRHAVWIWNAAWFLNEKTCLDNLQRLYEELQLGNIDRNMISKYYRSWIQVLTNFTT